MIKIKRALVSVSDKTGIIQLCQVLKDFQVEILSTGGTAKFLMENKIPVVEVSDYTGFPEILDGRVKTLHPKIHAGLLALRSNSQHMQTLQQHNIGPIDMVVVNLYPFERVTAKSDTTEEEAIENIDIGGPSMLRSAAKNYQSVVVICSVEQYSEIVAELKKNNGAISQETAFRCALKVFETTSRYDASIAAYFNNLLKKKDIEKQIFPETINLTFSKIQDLRYGENPHQKAAFYSEGTNLLGFANIKQLWGKELSFNNILDLNSAVSIAQEFKNPAVVFIKHNNPCGVAENKDLLKAYKDAWNCDRLSAFGGIIAINRPIDNKLANLIDKSGFLECIIAPSFSKEALEILKNKKNLRLLELADFYQQQKGFDYKRVMGGMLIQEPDNIILKEDSLKVVTKKKPTKKQMESLIFAWTVAKHVKSNAIVLAKGTASVGIGAGQMSRLDSVLITKWKAGKRAKNSCLASDAFFPKEDAVIVAAKMGVKAIIQPGGSMADNEIIRICDKYKIAMVFTGIRHFRH
ncbi:MAG: bifunctional phosphoribosylaminoimidazolecarboxamide formyltransferase/IMP cyclohydrolase [Candidatus Omnitrophica bacterium]|nr:bifunctional phosphoribosylaminoimidazolecarboxamide formyltransferase/IMP cyclohydrolase [Candidatus Omnitrophota bacterium]